VRVGDRVFSLAKMDGAEDKPAGKDPRGHPGH